MSLLGPTAMSVDTAIRRRRSVRGFLPNELPEPLLREIFELADDSARLRMVVVRTDHGVH